MMEMMEMVIFKGGWKENFIWNFRASVGLFGLNGMPRIRHKTRINRDVRMVLGLAFGSTHKFAILFVRMFHNMDIPGQDIKRYGGLCQVENALGLVKSNESKYILKRRQRQKSGQAAGDELTFECIHLNTRKIALLYLGDYAGVEIIHQGLKRFFWSFDFFQFALFKLLLKKISRAFGIGGKKGGCGEMGRSSGRIVLIHGHGTESGTNRGQGRGHFRRMKLKWD